jgi:glycosyltransferase domain-containing protein
MWRVADMDVITAHYSKSNLSSLTKLTLIIPTYNRNFYLSRCLWYHAHFPFGEIIVADSSPEEKKVINRKTVAKVREMLGANIRYLEYEPETEKYGGDIYRKWGDAVQHVGTKYSVISIDKAFVMPETLAKEIDFLENNSDYSSATGVWYCVDKHEMKQHMLAYFIPSDNGFNPLT